MIFSCNSLDLADALAKITLALPQRKLSAILDGIKMEAEGDYVKLTTTNMDFTIIKFIKADVKMSGEVLVPGKVFEGYIKKLNSDAEVEISDEDDKLLISCLDNKTTLNTLNISEYPVIKDYDYEFKISILQKEFKDLINKTAFSSNMTDDNRPVLKGCLLKIEDNKIQSVALDGFRMAICTKNLDNNYPSTEINISAKDLLKVVKLLEDDDEMVDLCFANKKLVITLKDMKVITTPIEGKFVNYQASIPKSFETEVTVNTRILESSIDRVSTLAIFEKSNLIKMEVKGNILSINSNSEFGDSTENINILSKGKDTLVGYNSKYITECLKNISDEYVVIKMNYTSPSIITGVEDSDYLYLILPVRYR